MTEFGKRCLTCTSQPIGWSVPRVLFALSWSKLHTQADFSAVLLLGQRIVNRADGALKPFTVLLYYLRICDRSEGDRIACEKVRVALYVYSELGGLEDIWAIKIHHNSCRKCQYPVKRCHSPSACLLKEASSAQPCKRHTGCVRIFCLQRVAPKIHFAHAQLVLFNVMKVEVLI